MTTFRTVRQTFGVIAKLDESYEVVSGWRRDRRNRFIMRKMPSANALISGDSGVKLHDYSCVLNAYRRIGLSGVHLYREMHPFAPLPGLKSRAANFWWLLSESN